jgi:hypothetical protein
MVEQLRDHYIICGYERVGLDRARGLAASSDSDSEELFAPKQTVAG